MFAEVFEVPAEVEDEELGFVVTGTEHVRCQAGSAADHLPELALRTYLFEQDEVEHFGNVDTGVEHVHGDRDPRHSRGILERFDEVLCAVGLVGDDAGKSPSVGGVMVVESLLDELRVTLVLREDDRLAELVTAFDFEPVGHQPFENKVDGVLIEQIRVQSGGMDIVGDLARFPLE